MFESTYRKLLEAGVIKPGDRHTIEPDPQPAPGGFKGLNPETVAAAMGPTMTEMQGATPIKRNPEDFVEDFTFPHRMLKTQAIMKEEEARRTRGLAQQALHTDQEADVDARVQKRAALEDRLDDLWNATECLAEDLQALDTDRKAHAAADYPETVPCPAPAPFRPSSQPHPRGAGLPRGRSEVWAVQLEAQRGRGHDLHRGRATPHCRLR